MINKSNSVWSQHIRLVENWRKLP